MYFWTSFTVSVIKMAVLWNNHLSYSCLLNKLLIQAMRTRQQVSFAPLYWLFYAICKVHRWMQFMWLLHVKITPTVQTTSVLKVGVLWKVCFHLQTCNVLTNLINLHYLVRKCLHRRSHIDFPGPTVHLFHPLCRWLGVTSFCRYCPSLCGEEQ